MDTKHISRTVLSFSVLAEVVWTTMLSASLFWNFHEIEQSADLMAVNTARANFNKDQAYRRWATGHGGVYVKPTEKTPPSPWMAHVPNRDVTTTTGTKLTLMNPAYMVREMMDNHSELYGIRGRIVGIVYLNPNNKADEWEADAIHRFEKGEKEIMEFIEIDGERWLKLMQPMVMSQGCQKCHGHLDFPNGSVRGGVSVSVPLAPYDKIAEQRKFTVALTHSFIWLAGLIAIVLLGIRTRSRSIDKQKSSEELALAAKVFENALDATVITDPDGVIIRVNRAFCSITGYSEEELIGEKPSIVKSDHHDHSFYHNLWSSLLHTGTWQGEIWNRKKDGSVFACWESITSSYDTDSTIKYYIGTFSDITNMKKIEGELKKLAHYDMLTGLPNRVLFMDRMDHALETAKRKKRQFAVFFIDLNGFKKINDTKGHPFGDKLLIEVGKRLKNALRPADTIARLGGDEFTIIIEDVEHVEQIATVAQKVLESISSPIIIEGYEMVVTGSLGISVYPQDGLTVDNILMHADTAMYKAKEFRTSRYFFYSEELTRQAEEFLFLETSLRFAIERKEDFEVYYQPKICVKSDKIVGMEALVRWNHPTLGLIPPNKFIPVAEELRLIDKIDRIVMDKACRQTLKWHDNGFDLRLAVNLSNLEIDDENLPDYIENILQQTGYRSDLLDIEVTESFFLTYTENHMNTFKRIREKGIKVSIDDFGTGYSSLSYLRVLPADILKIDQSFIRQISTSAKEATIVATIISLAHTLGMTVVAEGVEEASDFAFLKEKGCDEVQGYYFSKPLPAKEFEAFLYANQK